MKQKKDRLPFLNLKIETVHVLQRSCFISISTVTVQLPEYPFKNGQRLEVVVTEVLSPWEFWVQPIGSELDLLMEEMW